MRVLIRLLLHALRLHLHLSLLIAARSAAILPTTLLPLQTLLAVAAAAGAVAARVLAAADVAADVVAAYADAAAACHLSRGMLYRWLLPADCVHPASTTEITTGLAVRQSTCCDMICTWRIVWHAEANSSKTGYTT